MDQLDFNLKVTYTPDVIIEVIKNKLNPDTLLDIAACFKDGFQKLGLSAHDAQKNAFAYALNLVDLDPIRNAISHAGETASCWTKQDVERFFMLFSKAFDQDKERVFRVREVSTFVDFIVRYAILHNFYEGMVLPDWALARFESVIANK